MTGLKDEGININESQNKNRSTKEMTYIYCAAAANRHCLTSPQTLAKTLILHILPLFSLLVAICLISWNFLCDTYRFSAKKVII